MLRIYEKVSVKFVLPTVACEVDSRYFICNFSGDREC